MWTYILIWGGLGLVGAIIYLVRTGYLWPMVRDQVLPGLRVQGGTCGEIAFHMAISPVLVLLFLILRNFLLWSVAIVLGPIAIPLAIWMDLSRVIRRINIDLELDWRLELNDSYIDYVVGEVVLCCSKCDHLVPLGPCSDCGSIAYGPKGQFIECRKCDERIDHWTCPACGADNRVRHSLVRLQPHLVAGV